MTTEHAREVVARMILAAKAEEIAEDGWEDYPEIGEYDWDEITKLLVRLIAAPSLNEMQEAYRFLQDRAEK